MDVMIRTPISDPAEYLVRRKFPDPTTLFSRTEGPSGTGRSDGVSFEVRQKLKGIAAYQKKREAYRKELRAKPPEELRTLCEQEQEKERHEIQAKAERDEQQRFFNQSNAKADFTHWSKIDFWTLDEAVALSFGKDPKVVNWESVQKYTDRSPFAAEYGRVLELALRAKGSKRIYDQVLSSSFLAWARRTGIEVRSELVEQVEARGIVIADGKELQAKYDKLKKQTDADTAVAEMLSEVQNGTISKLIKERDARPSARIAPDNEPIARRKAPDTFIAALIRLIAEISKRAAEKGVPFDVNEMPGTKANFRELAIKFDDKLKKAPRTFDGYLAGLLRFKQGARETPFYQKHFPELFASPRPDP